MSVDTVTRQERQIDAGEVTAAIDVIKDALDRAQVGHRVAKAALEVVTGEFGDLAGYTADGDDRDRPKEEQEPAYSALVTSSKRRASAIRRTDEHDRAVAREARMRYAEFWSAPHDQREAARLLWVATQTETQARGIERALRRPGVTTGQAIDLQRELIVARRHVAAARRDAARVAWDVDKQQSRIVMVDADMREAVRATNTASRVDLNASDRLQVIQRHPRRDGLQVMALRAEAEATDAALEAARSESERIELAAYDAPQEAPHIRRLHQFRLGGVTLIAVGLRRQLRPHLPSVEQADRYKAMEARFDNQLNNDGVMPMLPEYAKYFFNPPEAPRRKPEGAVRYAYNVVKGTVASRLPRRAQVRTV